MLSLNTSDLQCLDQSTLFLCSTTNKQLQLLHTNRLFRDTFGIDEEKEECSSWLEATRVVQREKCIAAIRDCLRSPGKMVQAETAIKNNKDEERWFRWEISALTGEDNIVQGLRFIGTEISCQKQIEREEANKKKELVDAIIRAQERERQEISFELHDNVNQLLSTGMLVLDVAESHPRHARDYIRQSKNAIRKAIDEIRKITHSLNPATLDFVGLTASIQDIMKEINPTGKLHISFLPQGLMDEKTIAPVIQLTVFRIIQEQLTNIIRHSGGSNALLKLVRTGDMLQLEIRDNGIGFDMSATRRGLGLSNIFARAELYNGRAVLESAPGKGCLLKVVFPVTVG